MKLKERPPHKIPTEKLLGVAIAAKDAAVKCKGQIDRMKELGGTYWRYAINQPGSDNVKLAQVEFYKAKMELRPLEEEFIKAFKDLSNEMEKNRSGTFFRDYYYAFWVDYLGDMVEALKGEGPNKWDIQTPEVG
jgi:hypothetical protein